MELKDYREQIDRIDEEIVRLFQARMDVAAQIAKYKKENRLPILHSQREQEKLTAVCGQAREDMRPYLRTLYTLLFELSRAHQEKRSDGCLEDL